MADNSERRQFARLNMLADVAYTKSATVGRKMSVTRNISKGGICLIVYEAVKQDDILDLKIVLPGDTVAIEATGKVAWVKEFVIGDAATGKRYDVGIQFTKIGKKDAEKIDKSLFSKSLREVTQT